MCLVFCTSLSETTSIHQINDTNSFLDTSQRLLSENHGTSKLYIISGQKGMFAYEDDSLLSKRIAFLPTGFAVIGIVETKRRGLVITFPIKGWIPANSFKSRIIEFNSQTLLGNNPDEPYSALRSSERLAARLRTDATLTSEVGSNGPDAWTSQWPVGNGRVGALVGGSCGAEVIPFSSEGFFVMSNGRTSTGHPSHTVKLFQAARQDLRQGLPSDSAEKMSKLISPNPLGEFQYIFDLSLLYPSCLLDLTSPPLPSTRRGRLLETLKRSMEGSPISAHRSSPTNSTDRAWTALLDPHRKLVAPRRPSPRYRLPQETHGDSTTRHLPRSSDRKKSRNIFFSRRVLDTYTGIASSVHVVHGDEGVRYHLREWFGSAVDDVLVGRLSCRDLKGGGREGGNPSSGCLDVALRLSRDMSKGGGGRSTPLLLPEGSWRVVDWPSRRDYLKVTQPADGSSTAAISMSLHPSHTKSFHRGAEVCGALICSHSADGAPGNAGTVTP